MKDREALTHANARDPMVQTRIPPETLAWLRQQAALDGRSVANWLRHLLVSASDPTGDYLTELRARVRAGGNTR
jgi:hypothetical protein